MKSNGDMRRGVGARLQHTVYRALLRFYPAAFRAEFGAELLEVFEMELREAERGGFVALLGLARREVLAVPAAVAGAYRREHRRYAMAGPAVDQPQHTRRISWATVIALAAMIPLSLIGLVLASSLVYTTDHLRTSWAGEVYPSAEVGMRAIIARNYVQPEEVEMVYAGTNSFDGSQPHIWYVITCVWGGQRANGSAVGSSRHAYDQPGLFFVNTREGWVQVPEGAFPELVGFWLKVMGAAGPGSAQPSHDWGSSPTKCTF